MEVTESISDGLKRELKVVIGASELNQRLTDRLHEIKGSIRLKGFRPGKVPVEHLRKIYGRSVMAEIVQQAVQESSEKAVSDREERPATPPDVSLSDDEQIEKVIEGEADLAYTLSFEVLPEIKVADLTKIKLEKPVAEVTKEQVDAGIERLVKERITYTEKTGPAEEGDEVIVDFDGAIDGAPFDGGRAEDAPIVIGSKDFIPGFEEGLLGAKAGDERTLEIRFPSDYLVGRLAEKDAVFKVKIKRVGAPLKPKVDDEFANKLGFESVEKLREAVEQRFGEEYATASRMRVKRQLLDALDDAHKIELPQGLVEQEFEAIWNKINQDLKRAERTFEDEGTTEEAERERYRRIAERRVRLGLVLAEIGETAEVTVNDEEVNRALLERVRQFPGQEQQVYDFYQRNPQVLADLRAPIFEEKVVDYILELADVTEKEVTKDELFADEDDDDEN